MSQSYVKRFNEMKAVLCDPEGKVVIDGSEADRKAITDGLATFATVIDDKQMLLECLAQSRGEVLVLRSLQGDLIKENADQAALIAALRLEIGATQ